MIGLLHERLEEDLGMLMALTFVDEEKWTRA